MSGSLSDFGNALRSGNLLDALSHPATVNPMAAYGNALALANGVWANREAQAKQAVGAAYQGATDPRTGDIDTGAMLRTVAGNPAAALAAPGAAANGQALQQAQQNRSLQAQSAVNQGIASLMALPAGQQTQENYARVINSLPITEHDKGAALAEVHAAGSDPVALLQVAGRHLAHNLGAPDVASLFLPKGAVADTGGTLQPYVQQPATGAFASPGAPGAGGGPGAVAPAAGGLPLSLSPQAAGQPVQWVDKDGVTHNTTLAEYMSARGLGNVVSGGPAAAPAAAPGAAARPSPANPPRLGTTAPAGGAGALTDTNGPQPGQGEAWRASADAFAADRAAAGSYQERLFPLAQAKSLLDSGVQTGEGSEGVNRIKSWLTTRLPGDAQTIANSKFQELNKYLTRLANSNPMAAASDARLASALAGNPSAHLNTLANKDVLSAMIGLERMKQMAFTDFSASGQSPNQYADFQRQWASAHDPRAFVFDQMDEQRRAAMVKGMSPGERSAFARTLALVEQHPDVLNLAPLPH